MALNRIALESVALAKSEALVLAACRSLMIISSAAATTGQIERYHEMPSSDWFPSALLLWNTPYVHYSSAGG